MKALPLKGGWGVLRVPGPAQGGTGANPVPARGWDDEASTAWTPGGGCCRRRRGECKHRFLSTGLFLIREVL